MSVPMGPDRLVAALHAEGIRVVEHRSWRTHNRNHKGPWGPVHGVMIHHTVSSGEASSVELCYNGHANLPGPLCQGVIAKDGTVYLVANGRANHAGLGDGDVLNAVINETPLPADNEADTDGNRHFYGFECINLGDGKDSWPAEQLDAIERTAAAICRIHGWSADSVIGHLEWQPGKVDPRGFAMSAMRNRVTGRLRITPGKPTTPAPKPEAPKPPVAVKPKFPVFPGRDKFGPGKSNAHVTRLGKQLVKRGHGQFYSVGPGPKWGEADRRAVRAFQLTQKDLKGDADGLPGPLTWKLLFS